MAHRKTKIHSQSARIIANEWLAEIPALRIKQIVIAIRVGEIRFGRAPGPRTIAENSVTDIGVTTQD